MELVRPLHRGSMGQRRPLCACEAGALGIGDSIPSFALTVAVFWLWRWIYCVPCKTPAMFTHPCFDLL